MPPPDKNRPNPNGPPSKANKLAADFATAAFRARIFDLPQFDKPDALADYCLAVAKKIAETPIDSDGDNG